MMDYHMYKEMWNHVRFDIIPRFREEYKKYGKMSSCPSYEKVKDFCKAINIVGPYAICDYERITPKTFIKE